MKTIKFIVFAVVLTAVAGLYAADADVIIDTQAPVAVATKDATPVAPIVADVNKDDAQKAAEAPKADVVVPATPAADVKKDDTPKVDVVAPVAPVQPQAEPTAPVAAPAPAQTPVTEPKKDDTTKPAQASEATKPAEAAPVIPVTQTESKQPEQTAQAAQNDQPNDAELEKFFEMLSKEQGAAADKQETH